MNPVPQRPVVFYDGGCPRCRREIAHYRRRTDADRLDWIDIHAHPEALAGTGIRWETAMRRFHVMDENGRWHTGLEGFHALWQRIPGYRWLARVTGLPGLHALIAGLYNRWAERRFRRRMTKLLGND